MTYDCICMHKQFVPCCNHASSTLKTLYQDTTNWQREWLFMAHWIPLILTKKTDSNVLTDFCIASQPTIRHVTSVPYHLASNSLAETAIQTFKCAIEKLTKDSLENWVIKFLFKYCITPCTVNHRSFAIWFAIWQVSSFTLRLALNSNVCQKQNSQKQTWLSQSRILFQEYCFRSL